MTTPAGLPVKKGAPDDPPPYATPPATASSSSSPTSPARARLTSGFLDFTHLNTLSAEQLCTFDQELVARLRYCLSDPKHWSGPKPKEFREWLRGYGFFVSFDATKYGRRGLEEARPLGERVGCMLARSMLNNVEGSAYVLIWVTLGELLEVRGLQGVVGV